MIITLLAMLPAMMLAQARPVTHKPPAKLTASPAAIAAANGRKMYVKYCLSCHQADGGGVMNMNPPLTGTAYVQGDKNKLIKLVLSGFNEGVEINGQSYTNAMPSFSYLKDKEVADVLTYVRTHFTNKAAAIKPADVTAVRATLKLK
jgi:mono/diheme cytochrome c family protein